MKITTDAANASGTSSEERIAILLVDDDPDCRMLARDAISSTQWQYRVFEVSSAEDAIRFLQRQAPFGNAVRPDLIFLDIEMPGLDGLSLLKRVKADPSLREIRTIMMTGIDDEKQIRIAMAAGADGYTVKPDSPEEFRRAVIANADRWLGCRDSARAKAG